MSERPETEYSTLEVDQSVNAPQYRPGENDMPEPVREDAAKTDSLATVPPPTICGLRKRTFWIAIGVLATLVIIGIAVGVGVGVGTREHGTATSTYDDTVVNSTKVIQRGVAPESKLAAANYTDADGAEHSQVFYQNATTLDIWMGDFNNNTANWTFSPISAQNSETPILPKNGTPIATYNYLYDDVEYPDFHVTFIDINNTIRALWASNMSEHGWSVEHTLDDQALVVDTDSGLAAYGPQCRFANVCDEESFIVYSNASGQPFICYPGLESGEPQQLDGYRFHDADQGTALAVVPVPIVNSRNDTGTRVAMYLRRGGQLVELYGYPGDWGISAFDLPENIDEGGQLAAMNRHTNRQGSNSTDALNSWVFITQSSGGVKLVYGGGLVTRDAWTSTNSIPGMEDVLPLSPIAATQAGKVYALEKKDDGTPQIVEWRLESWQDITFERVQVVDTPE